MLNDQRVYKMKQHLIPKVQLYFAPSNATKETWAVCPSILPSKQQKELKELAVDTLQLGKCLANSYVW